MTVGECEKGIFEERLLKNKKTERQGKNCPSLIICCYHTETFIF